MALKLIMTCRVKCWDGNSGFKGWWEEGKCPGCGAGVWIGREPRYLKIPHSKLCTDCVPEVAQLYMTTGAKLKISFYGHVKEETGDELSALWKGTDLGE